MLSNPTREQLQAKLTAKLLTKQITGQRSIMAGKASSSSRERFTYGPFQDVYLMTFVFLRSIGGYSGAPLQEPPKGYEWIEHPTNGLRFEVKAKDLEGNYREKDLV
jgi:hypothetical protein